VGLPRFPYIKRGNLSLSLSRSLKASNSKSSVSQSPFVGSILFPSSVLSFSQEDVLSCRGYTHTHAKRLHSSHRERLVIHGEALVDYIAVCVSSISRIEEFDPAPSRRDHIGVDLPNIMSLRLGGIHLDIGIAMIRIFIELFRNYPVRQFLDPNLFIASHR
jgi:hypothetical protein